MSSKRQICSLFANAAKQNAKYILSITDLEGVSCLFNQVSFADGDKQGTLKNKHKWKSIY